MVRSLWLSLMLLCSSAYAVQDPTAPLGWVKPEQTNKVVQVKHHLPTLHSIVCQSAQTCIAILNSDVVGIGETVRGYTVTQIAPDAVTLTRGAKQWTLELFNLDVKE